MGVVVNHAIEPSSVGQHWLITGCCFCFLFCCCFFPLSYRFLWIIVYVKKNQNICQSEQVYSSCYVIIHNNQENIVHLLFFVFFCFFFLLHDLPLFNRKENGSTVWITW